MSGVDDILSVLPIDQLASQLASDPAMVEQAASIAIPAILGGLQANSADAAGAGSLLNALTQHSGDLLGGGFSLDQIDVADGEKAASHIFGSNQDQVINQLGSTGVGSQLIRKLLPILIPIVLSYIAKQMSNKGAAPSRGGSDSQITFPGQEPQAAPAGAGASAGGGVLGDVLQQVLTGALQGAGAGKSSSAAGSILGDLLGGLLGGGRRQ